MNPSKLGGEALDTWLHNVVYCIHSQVHKATRKMKMFSTGHKVGLINSGAKTSYSGYKMGDTLRVTEGEYKGQQLTVKSVSGAYVVFVKDNTKPPSLYNILSLPNSKVEKV